MAQPNFVNRTLWTGDNLDILRGMNSECVDLIYLDPPFNSRHDYAAPIGSEAAGAAFKDTWSLSDLDVAWMGLIAEEQPAVHQVLLAARETHGKGMQSYLTMMAVRLIEMHRVLKPTGSIYLHCDDYADAYLKLTMDAIFGGTAFANSITWQRQSSKALSIRKYARNSDRILFYRMSKESTWNQQYVEFTEKYLESFRYEDEFGKYNTQPLTGGRAGGQDAYGEFRGVFPSPGRAWAPPRREKFPPEVQVLLPDSYEQLGQIEKCEVLDGVGLIHWSAQGVPRYKSYLSMRKGAHVGDIIVDIYRVTGDEDVGYPTQKPLALLERIIKASSDEDGVVLDPFAGCATACVAAERLGRQWVGIDLSPKAVELVNIRLQQAMGGLFHNRLVTARTDIPRRTDIDSPINYRQNKHVLFGHQEGICNGCRTEFPFRIFEVDHVIPQSRGGTNHLDNLQLLCAHCNRLKGDRTQEYLLARLKEMAL
ncbi:MAG: DNA methyltransferase [Chloroflexota bacterium]|nr:DNA methyltransferase [Chloroflexota bacterium]MDE2941010.1 DNA methyltransferase [Chloroflexota bacterium]MDE3268222.1 DNA methyltransferase [Chloroflexota bacterium]